MKAITTKYHPATDTHGSRISARDSDGNWTFIPYPHELSGEECHRAAAVALCDKMGWTGKMAGGSTKDGYAFIFTEKPKAKPSPPPLTPVEFGEDDFARAEAIAKRLGFTQTAYTSTSGLWGLFCLPDHSEHRHGCIIKTQQFGLMFVADLEDMLMEDLKD